jgi:hypothetical protein
MDAPWHLADPDVAESPNCYCISERATRSAHLLSSFHGKHIAQGWIGIFAL